MIDQPVSKIADVMQQHLRDALKWHMRARGASNDPSFQECFTKIEGHISAVQIILDLYSGGVLDKQLEEVIGLTQKHEAGLFWGRVFSAKIIDNVPVTVVHNPRAIYYLDEQGTFQKGPEQPYEERRNLPKTERVQRITVQLTDDKYI